MNTLVYVLAAIGGFYLLWRIYRALTPSKSHDLPDDLDEDCGLDGWTGAALSAHLCAPYVEGNRLELLINGDDTFPVMLDAIARAERSINFLTFVYWQGDIAQQFAHALAAAAKRGVEVRVLLDAFGALKMRDELAREMREAGCRISYFHPFRFTQVPRYNWRTHRKVMVIDGREGFTGGVGIADEWTGNAQDPEHWRDNHFRVTGPAVRYLQGAFAENWREAAGEVLVSRDFYPPLEPAGDSGVIPIFSEAGGSVSPIAFSYWLLIRAARKRVWIVTPYFLPSRDLMDELRSAARRGVDVALLLPGEHNDVTLVQYGSEAYYDELLSAGIRLYEHRTTMIHAKTMVVDDDFSFIGSANFDNRSFDLNYEISLCVLDRPFNQRLAELFDADLERSHRVTREDLKETSVFRRLRNNAALAFRPQL